jgi:hypothetical protein
MPEYTSNLREKGSTKSNHQSSDRPVIESSGEGYRYMSGIAKEYISNPEAYLQRSVIIDNKTHSFKAIVDSYSRNGLLGNQLSNIVINPWEYGIMPDNSVIAYIIDKKASVKGMLPVICYPFFPSHFSLPVKPGEHIWIIKESAYSREVYYWMCRKTGAKYTEDTNYTHLERLEAINEELIPGDTQINGSLFVHHVAEPSALNTFNNMIDTNLPEGFSNGRIVAESLAFKEEFTSEPVPPVRKKCGDTLIQGSNNNLIHLTTEKFLRNEDNSLYFTGKTTQLSGDNSVSQTGRMPLSPAIDICVGRKKESLLNLANASDDSAKSNDLMIVKNKRQPEFVGLENYEIDKLGELSEQQNSFNTTISTDTNATDCGARLYLSNNCAVDETFGSSFDVLDTLGGSCLATYADHNRVIADNSLRLANRIGESFLNMDSSGNIVIKSSINNGQQFLSLRNNGVSRLQARDKIEFAVSSDNDVDVNTVNEPYVLYSELAPFLKKVSGDVAFFNQIINLLMSVLQSFPPVAAIYQPLVQARAARDNGASAGMTVSIPEQEIKDKDDKILHTIPKYTLSIPAETLGDNINISNFVTEAQEVVDVLIKSTKIFGEANDKD